LPNLQVLDCGREHTPRTPPAQSNSTRSRTISTFDNVSPQKIRTLILGECNDDRLSRSNTRNPAQILRYYHVEKWRVGTIARAGSVREAFAAEAPRINVPPSPALAALPLAVRPDLRRAIVTEPLSRRKMMNEDADFHELTGMVARLGTVVIGRAENTCRSASTD
jgi:hypothetical protein